MRTKTINLSVLPAPKTTTTSTPFTHGCNLHTFIPTHTHTHMCARQVVFLLHRGGSELTFSPPTDRSNYVVPRWPENFGQQSKSHTPTLPFSSERRVDGENIKAFHHFPYAQHSNRPARAGSVCYWTSASCLRRCRSGHTHTHTKPPHEPIEGTPRWCVFRSSECYDSGYGSKIKWRKKTLHTPIHISRTWWKIRPQARKTDSPNDFSHPHQLRATLRKTVFRKVILFPQPLGHTDDTPATGRAFSVAWLQWWGKRFRQTNPLFHSSTKQANSAHGKV